ncbi:pyrroloquinoline-quinone synthase [Granulicella pectinivorans]|jgi:pyrroloquinoline-quinone synthase|uniref:Pyrroloquinoline-quinone synthase n=1 Tax=Granulicella pectinivorans TaxID=474950 RepID=A0A1I6LEV2_9BACT|nr:iron-containing redox enzyme family protein [Granulicella pectinivorans]SFS01972.1 pyrroloquinoline-quinone synthase [Granulicella pectinivorans]
MTETMTIEPRFAAFWSRFEARVAKYDLLKHPFYQAWSRGELTTDDLRAYGAEYWHHVAAFPTYLSRLHAVLPEGELRRDVLRNLAEEEGIDRTDGRAHSGLWMDFAKGMGASEGEVRGFTVQPEMTCLLETFRGLMNRASGGGCGVSSALAGLYSYESKVPEIAATKADGLAEHYGVTGGAAKYFTIHRTADLQHAAVWRGLIEEQIDTVPGAEEAALKGGECAAKALWSALDGIERRRMAA